MHYLRMTINPLAIASVFLCLSSQAVSAVQYETILQTGQTVPGETKPVSRINDYAIDTQQNIVALISTRENEFNAASIYSIRPNTQLKQLDRILGSSFAPVSISLGEVGYIVPSIDLRPDQRSRYELKFGRPESIKTILTVDTIPYNKNAGIDERLTGLAIVNGKGFLIANQPAQLGQPELRGLVQFQNNQFSVLLKPNDPIFTAGGNPPLQLNGRLGPKGTSNPRPFTPVRASSETLVLSRPIDRSFQVFERPNGGSFRKIYEGLTGKLVSSESCGIAASRSNVAVCSAETPNNTTNTIQSVPKILLRIGKTGQFNEVKFARKPGISVVEALALSGNTLAFSVRQEPPNYGTEIYVSNNGAAAQRLIGRGDELNGKVIRDVDLAANGQSIGNGFLLFEATFSDGAQTLYKAIL
jgi:hypothetical protein